MKDPKIPTCHFCDCPLLQIYIMCTQIGGRPVPQLASYSSVKGSKSVVETAEINLSAVRFTR